MARTAMSMDELIDDFVNVMARGFVLRSKNIADDVWPYPVLSPLESNIGIPRTLFPALLDTIRKLEARGHSEEAIARLFHAPSRISRITYLSYLSYLSPLTVDERVELFGKLILYISHLRDDVFCSGGKNVLLDGDGVTALTAKTPMVDIAGRDDADGLRTLVNRIAALLWLYSEMLYFYYHQIGHEQHGPYALEGGRVLIVKDFYDMKPGFWEFSGAFPVERLTLLSVYPDTEISFDYSNRMKTTEALGLGLERYSIHGLDLPAQDDIESLQSLYSRMQEAMDQAITHVQGLDADTLAIKFGEMMFYSIKPLRDELGEDWRPPPQFYEDVRERRLTPGMQKIAGKLGRFAQLEDVERFRFLKGLFDPRTAPND